LARLTILFQAKDEYIVRRPLVIVPCASCIQPQAVGVVSDNENPRLSVRHGDWLHGDIQGLAQRLIGVLQAKVRTYIG
jgi:hypothetical protein